MISTVQLSSGRLEKFLDKLPDALSKGIERGLERATEHLRSAVAELAQSPLGASTVGSFGEYAASVRGAVQDERGRSIGEVFLAPPADQYGLFVEVGTQPHFPPPGALLGWVRRRLGIAAERQVREVAFLIGRKIARQGTQGHFFFEKALRDNEQKVIALLEQELDQALTAE